MNKLKEFKIIKKKLNKRGKEILRNCQILCFIDKKNISDYFKLLKNNINNKENEKKFIQYIENFWLKKDPDIYNYSFLINEIIQCKNLYIKKKW